MRGAGSNTLGHLRATGFSPIPEKAGATERPRHVSNAEEDF